jgi:hypothetical protein
MASGLDKLPTALLNKHIVTYKNDGIDDTHDGLVYADNLEGVFYPPCETYKTCQSFTDVPPNGLASVDTNSDGIYDVLYGIADTNVTFKLDKNGDEVWRKELSTGSNLDYIWAGKRIDGTEIELIASGGNILAFDKNGQALWTERCIDYSVENIVHDKNGGFLVTGYGKTGQPDMCKLNETNGSIAWYKYDINLIAQNDSRIAVSKMQTVQLLDEKGSLIHEANISSFHSDYFTDGYLHASSLRFGTLGAKSGLYVGSMDIHRMNTDGTLQEIFSGGDLIQAMASGDMDNDGADEIVAEDMHRLYLYDNTGKLLWKKDEVTLLEHLQFADLSGNGRKMLIANVEDNISIIDIHGNTLWSINSNPNIIETADYNNDGAQDLYVSDDTDFIKVYNGKNGELLRNFGKVDSACNYFLKVFNIDGITRLFYEDGGNVYWIDSNETAGKHPTSLKAWWSYKFDYANYTDDNISDIVIGKKAEDDDAVFDISIYDPVANKNVLTITIPEKNVKKIKLVHLTDDGKYTLLVISKGKVALYDLKGKMIWDYTVDQSRNLSDVKIADSILYVAGKEIYVLDKNGKKLEEISSTNYMSSTEYFVKTTLTKSKTTSKVQLVEGTMGLYSYHFGK